MRRTVSALMVAGILGILLLTPTTLAQSQSCGLSQPAFCETFDAPAGTGNRSGDLNGTLWGVSRTIGGTGTNFGQGLYDGWMPTSYQDCSGTQIVQPQNDVHICNGQLREAINDNGDVVNLAMYPKQPFDFAGRTGLVTFDVSNDSPGIHSTWPEFWITDQPIPSPFTHFDSWEAVPRNGLGIRFAGGGGCNDGIQNHWTVDSAVVVRNYVPDGSLGPGGGQGNVQMLACVTGPTSMAGAMNHIEIHISQNLIDVYATDAGATALKHIATIPNVNLSFSRGLVWLEDAHYNASKGGGIEQHTFAWDNLGFDGPVLPRDLAFDAPDAQTSVGNYPGIVNLGYNSTPSAPARLNIPGVNGMQNASAALLTFNFFHYTAPASLTYVVNGHVHTQSWPYPETNGFTWRTLAVPVPISDVVAGNNSVSISSDQQMAVANVDLILVGAGGGGVPQPTNTPIPPTSTATNTPVPPTSTPVPTSTTVPAACYLSVSTDGTTTHLVKQATTAACDGAL